MKRLILVIAVCAALAAPAHAEWFVGVGAGQSSVDTDIPLDIDPDIDFDGDDTGYKLFGGYALGKHLTFEAAAFDLGTVTASSFFGDVDVDIYGADIAVTAGVPFLKVAGFYGKFGYAWWRFEATGSNGETRTDHGTDFMWGLGLRVAIGPVTLRGEWELFDLGDADEVSLISLGLAYRF